MTRISIQCLGGGLRRTGYDLRGPVHDDARGIDVAGAGETGYFLFEDFEVRYKTVGAGQFLRSPAKCKHFRQFPYILVGIP
jgi:hypothetical protein